jgi:hypothetical protein
VGRDSKKPIFYIEFYIILAFLYIILYNFSAHLFSHKWAKPGQMAKNLTKIASQKILDKNISGQAQTTWAENGQKIGPGPNRNRPGPTKKEER